MISIRRSKERGYADHGWLKSFHSFSFADYHDPNFMGFRNLRVINEDWIYGGTGFQTHGHRDMEIFSYVVEGALRHQDTLGNVTLIKPGEIQRMTAGTGIRHSEFNELKDQKTHLLQIWILPGKHSDEPGYDQADIVSRLKGSALALVAGPESSENPAIVLRADARIFAFKGSESKTFDHSIPSGRHAWVQLVKGELTVNGESLKPGDALAASNESSLQIAASAGAEFLVFDLP